MSLFTAATNAIKVLNKIFAKITVFLLFSLVSNFLLLSPMCLNLMRVAFACSKQNF